jgi:hypothetical protein
MKGRVKRLAGAALPFFMGIRPHSGEILVGSMVGA